MFRLMYSGMTDLQEEILSSYIQKAYAKKGISDSTNTNDLTSDGFSNAYRIYMI